MKTLILAVTLMAFAVVSQADEAKPAKQAKETGSCCEAKTTAKVKNSGKCSDKDSCCKEKQQVKLMSPKAAAEMGR